MKGSPTITFLSGILMTKERREGDEGFSWARMDVRMVGEGEGDKEYRTSNAMCFKSRNDGGGETMARVLSYTN